MEARKLSELEGEAKKDFYELGQGVGGFWGNGNQNWAEFAY